MKTEALGKDSSVLEKSGEQKEDIVMRKIRLITVILLLNLGLMLPINMVFADRLPSSLDRFYPPKAEQPIYLFRMFGLGGLFSGIASDLVENDLQGARDVFEKFRTEYVEISKLVPEWKKGYPMGPVEGLGAALKLGDRKKVMAARRRLVRCVTIVT